MYLSPAGRGSGPGRAQAEPSLMAWAGPQHFESPSRQKPGSHITNPDIIGMFYICTQLWFLFFSFSFDPVTTIARSCDLSAILCGPSCCPICGKHLDHKCTLAFLLM